VPAGDDDLTTGLHRGDGRIRQISSGTSLAGLLDVHRPIWTDGYGKKDLLFHLTFLSVH
jgi:hypothetical protein